MFQIGDTIDSLGQSYFVINIDTLNNKVRIRNRNSRGEDLGWYPASIFTLRSRGPEHQERLEVGDTVECYTPGSAYAIGTKGVITQFYGEARKNFLISINGMVQQGYRSTSYWRKVMPVAENEEPDFLDDSPSTPRRLATSARRS